MFVNTVSEFGTKSKSTIEVKYEQVINKTKFEKQKGISWIVNAAELQIVKSNFSYEYVRVELMYPS